MKKVILSLLFLGALMITNAQKQTFPSVEGTTLDGKRVQIPVGNNKFTVVGVVFKRSAEDELKKWLNPLFSTFVQKTEKNAKSFDMTEDYDVNFYFIPAIAGIKLFAKEFKESTDKGFWPYIVDADLNARGLRKQFKEEDNDIPYFYVLDKSGKILEVVSGKFSKDKLAKLEEAVDQE